ncbi:MAG: aminotransferase class V-fold PLP-dependent enzyme [Candidatus Auribacterota bacterium]|nr:aminotransferase class V-fold PLP-dependent enzyme [Candidatus Auribacterota bacterium]
MKNKSKVYLDQAATSFPKPEAVYQAVDKFARTVGIGSGRGFYRESREAGRIFQESRGGIARLIGAKPEEIILNSGTTESLNTLLLGFLREGDHVIISPFEHNSATRPLNFLARDRGVSFTMLRGTLERGISPEEIESEIRPETRLCLINHISNAFGIISPIREIGRILRRHDKIIFAVDGAQSMGTYPIDINEMQIDFLSFSGHKGLLGPTSTGGFYIREGLAERIRPLSFGGTGIRSLDPIMIGKLPLKYEVGTMNSWGVAGMLAGINFILEQGLDSIHNHIEELTLRAAKKISRIDSITAYLPSPAIHHSVISFNLGRLGPRETASLLDKIFNIKVRDGLHCSPDAHRTIGTSPLGTVRASFGALNTKDDVDYLCEALSELAKSFKDAEIREKIE